MADLPGRWIELSAVLGCACGRRRCRPRRWHRHPRRSGRRNVNRRGRRARDDRRRGQRRIRGRRRGAGRGGRSGGRGRVLRLLGAGGQRQQQCGWQNERSGLHELALKVLDSTPNRLDAVSAPMCLIVASVGADTPDDRTTGLPASRVTQPRLC